MGGGGGQPPYGKSSQKSCFFFRRASLTLIASLQHEAADNTSSCWDSTEDGEQVEEDGQGGKKHWTERCQHSLFHLPNLPGDGVKKYVKVWSFAIPARVIGEHIID